MNKQEMHEECTREKELALRQVERCREIGEPETASNLWVAAALWALGAIQSKPPELENFQFPKFNVGDHL